MCGQELLIDSQSLEAPRFLSAMRVRSAVPTFNPNRRASWGTINKMKSVMQT